MEDVCLLYRGPGHYNATMLPNSNATRFGNTDDPSELEKQIRKAAEEPVRQLLRGTDRGLRHRTNALFT